MTHKLVLFDIDQTIILSGGAGQKALVLALRDRFGRDEDLSNVEIQGKTDVWIAHRLFELHGIEPHPENIRLFLDGYLQHLETQLALNNGRLLPGFPAILHAIAALPNVAIGLLTGNLRRGAELKLGHYGLLAHFPFGAYSDDSLDRNKLVPFAQRRAREIHGADFPPENIYVIGDTPHDIACAKAVGAHGVGVATGDYSTAALKSAGADHVFEDLSDVQSVIATLGLST